EEEMDYSEQDRLFCVLPHVNTYKSLACWGLRQFKTCLVLLGRSQQAFARQPEPLLDMNVGTVLARVYLALSSPERARLALEEHYQPSSTKGMEAEYEAWWSLLLACEGHSKEALSRGQKLQKSPTVWRSEDLHRGQKPLSLFARSSQKLTHWFGVPLRSLGILATSMPLSRPTAPILRCWTVSQAMSRPEGSYALY